MLYKRPKVRKSCAVTEWLLELNSFHACYILGVSLEDVLMLEEAS